MKTKLAQAAFILVLLAAMAAAFLMGEANRKRPAPVAAKILSAEQRKVADGLISDRIIRIEERRGKVWIDPQEWRSVDAQAKEQISALFAGYIWDSGFWTSGIEIYDMQSAKRLATYGRLGFKAD